MKRILITGGSGLLGQYLNKVAAEKNRIHTIFNNNIGNCPQYPSSKTDIKNSEELENLFNDFNPEIVIHTAAITNPTPKESQLNKDYFETNVKASKNIAELCEKGNAKVVYVSTDLVYAGYRGSFLKEEGKLIPATLYAETKLIGEEKIKQASDNYLILRTALLYGIGMNHSRCHFQLMLENLKSSKAVRLFTDQFRTPISLYDASNIILGLATSDLREEIINVGGIERVSRCELGEILCSIGGYDKKLIQKITMDDIPGFPKVEDVSLNTDKLQSFGFKPESIEDNIHKIINS